MECNQYGLMDRGKRKDKGETREKINHKKGERKDKGKKGKEKRRKIDR